MPEVSNKTPNTHTAQCSTPLKFAYFLNPRQTYKFKFFRSLLTIFSCSLLWMSKNPKPRKKPNCSSETIIFKRKSRKSGASRMHFWGSSAQLLLIELTKFPLKQNQTTPDLAPKEFNQLAKIQKPAHLLVVPIKHLQRIHSRPESPKPNRKHTPKVIQTSPNPQETIKSDAVGRETEADERIQRASTAGREGKRRKRGERERAKRPGEGSRGQREVGVTWEDWRPVSLNGWDTWWHVYWGVSQVVVKKPGSKAATWLGACHFPGYTPLRRTTQSIPPTASVNRLSSNHTSSNSPSSHRYPLPQNSSWQSVPTFINLWPSSSVPCHRGCPHPHPGR